MLLPRLITALVGIPLIVLIVHIGSLAYTAFILLIIVLSLYEYSILMKLGSKKLQNETLFLFGILIPVAFFLDNYYIRAACVDNFLPLILSLTIIFCCILELFLKAKSIERLSSTLFGIFFISWNLMHMVAIRNIRPDGEGLTFMIFITVWFMDTAAYFAGKAFGKKKLSIVSPQKTWEGAITSFFAAMISVLIIRVFLKNTLNVSSAVILGIIIGISGQLSDLSESMLKRSVGVKDSSNLLPGHGGILDRFDSFIFIAPITYYFVVVTR